MNSSHLVTQLFAVVALVALVVGWVAVQRAWARVFPDAFDDPDVLAERGGCGGCGCITPCRQRAGRSPKESS